MAWGSRSGLSPPDSKRKHAQEWMTVAWSSHGRHCYLCGREEPPGDCRALAPGWGPGDLQGPRPARPCLCFSCFGTDVLHRGEALELEGVDSSEYQRHVGPSSYLQQLSPQAVDLEEGEQSRKRNKETSR